MTARQKTAVRTGNEAAGLSLGPTARVNVIEMGRWPMTTFGKLTTLTAYLSLAFVGAIVLGLL
ncbi:MAG: hypothetical protein WBA29_04270 [Xanthobacteraceae bacterium]